MNQPSKDEKKAERKRNREAMPNVAELVDQLKVLYGPIRVIGAEDYVTGKKIGKLDE